MFLKLIFRGRAEKWEDQKLYLFFMACQRQKSSKTIPLSISELFNLHSLSARSLMLTVEDFCSGRRGSLAQGIHNKRGKKWPWLRRCIYDLRGCQDFFFFFCWKASAQTIIIQWRINQIGRHRERWRREKRVVLTQHWLSLRGTVVQRHGPSFLPLSAPAADTNHIPADTVLLGTLEERRGREEDWQREVDRQWGELTVSESQRKLETDCFSSLKHLECDTGIFLSAKMWRSDSVRLRCFGQLSESAEIREGWVNLIRPYQAQGKVRFWAPILV